MLDITIGSNLNSLDREIHDSITAECKTRESLTIMQASELCHCSPSKISKFVKKLGFSNYKQYIDYLYGRKITTKTFSNEFERIKHFLDTFDLSVIDKFIDTISRYKKIALLGYGPSKYCAQYFQFKLQLFSNQTVIMIDDEFSAASLINEDTLLIIFSATGSYQSFRNFQNIAQEKGAHLLLLVEEYNTSIIPQCGEVLFLTDTFQTISSIPYEKSRIVFFIFIEEVMSHLLRKKI